MRTRTSVIVLVWASLVVLHGPLGASGADWPQWRCDAGRTAASPAELPAELHLRWRRQLPPPSPAWPKYPRLRFDASYEPVVMGKTMFLGSMVTDTLTALDVESGAEKWRYYADGPVRFAPVAWRGKVFFVSDDGHLYCLDAAEGKLLWKFRGLPAGRKDTKVLGNERLISLWPARGGPVLADGVVYFAAGIWPFEGVYVHAVDAETGKAIWSNTESGFVKEGLVDHGLQRGPRGASGVSPQGYLTVVGEKLIVPCGRALPAFFDRKTGKIERYLTGWGGRTNLAKGSWYVPAAGKYFAHTGDLCELATGAHLQVDPANRKEIGQMRQIVMTDEAIYYSRQINTTRPDSYRPVGTGSESIVACDVTKPTFRVHKDKRREDWKRATLRELWRLRSDLEVHLKAGSRLYAGAPGLVAAVNIPPKEGGEATVAWKARIQGTPARMLAAGGKLFAVTRAGAIYCFGAKGAAPRRYPLATDKGEPADDRWGRKAAAVLKKTPAGRLADAAPGKPTVAMQFDRKPVDVSWPTQWQVFGPMPKDAKLQAPSAVTGVPLKLTLDGKDYLPQALSTFQWTLDLSCLYGGYGLKPLQPGQKPTAFPRPKARSDSRMQWKLAYAVAHIDCPTAGRLTIGTHTPGRMTWYLDGKCIYDASSNTDVWTYFGLRGRMFSTQVSAGRHVLAVALRADRRGWHLTAEAGAKHEPDFKAEMTGIPHTEAMQGYCLVWGIGTGRLVEEISRQSGMHVIAVDPDAKKVDALRRRTRAAGLYGRRVAAHVADPLAMPFPPYLADLIASEDPSVLLAARGGAGEADRTKALTAKLLHCLRPFGGVACLPLPEAARDDLVRSIEAAKPAGVKVTQAGQYTLVRRSGGLGDSRDWTHERGDAANTLYCADRRVRTPLRMLWFGGSVDRVFPNWDFTHSRHPIPLVAQGRVFFLTAWTLAASDAYTGRILWKVPLPAPERWYHTYAVARGGLYVICAGKLRRLDPATGRTLAEIGPPTGVAGPWRQIRLWRGLLVGQVGSHAVAIDRRDGKLLWSFKCKGELTDLAVARKRVFLVDCPPPGRADKLTPGARLVALDATDGNLLWEATTTLWTGPRRRPRVAYSASNDTVVIQHKGLQAYNGKSGEQLWKQDTRQAVPYILHPSMIVNARTGEMFDTLSGEKRPQRLWPGGLRGCSYAVASEYVLTVRDGHATYFDLPSGRRMFMRGLRAGCTPSLIPANGLVNIPNFARGCSCNYAIFTSSALVPTSAVEK